MLSDKQHTLLFGAIVSILAIIYYQPSFFQLPDGQHAWAQSDRLSLAHCFYEDLSTFFYPRSYHIASMDRIVGVELPLQSYLAALLAQPFGKGAVSPIFRLIDILISLVGLFSLFAIGLRYLRFKWLAYIPALFLWTSPIFVFYSGTYLPDTASVGFIFPAAFFLICFWEDGHFRYAWWSLLFISLAFFIKMSSGGYWVTTVLLLGLGWIKHRKWVGTHFILFGTTVVLVGLSAIFYLQHVNYLNTHYFSKVFLSAPKPITGSFVEQWNFALSNWKRWEYDYLTRLHQWWILLAALFSIYAIFRKSIRWKIWHGMGLGWLFAAFVGYYFMAEQFYHHDYYFNTCLVPITAWLVLSLCLGIDSLKLRVVSVVAVLSILAVFPDFYNTLQQKAKATSGAWFTKADFSQLTIPKDATVLLQTESYPAAFNLSLIYIDRYGFPFGIPDFEKFSPHFIASIMGFYKLDYFVASRAYSDYLKRSLPNIDLLLPLVEETAAYTVYRCQPALLHYPWTAKVDSFVLDYETLPYCDSTLMHSGLCARQVTHEQAWMASFIDKVDAEKLDRYDSIEYTMHYFLPDATQADSVTVLGVIRYSYQEDKKILLKTMSNPDARGWRMGRVSFPLPTQPDYFILLFPYPVQGKPIYVDDVKVSYK